MKQFVLWMAIVGLATTGCAQNRVLGPHARRGGADFQVARSQPKPRKSLRASLPSFRMTRNETDELRNERFDEEFDENNIELAAFGSRCRGCETCDDSCCGGCEDGCCGDCATGDYCGCDEGCSGGDGCCGNCCDSGCCGDDGCSSECGSGCSACGGRGCGLCQRMAGRFAASGICPHSGGYPESYNYNPSPPTGQVAYPYYTVRGPRDFLRNNPPSIGPY